MLLLLDAIIPVVALIICMPAQLSVTLPDLMYMQAVAVLPACGLLTFMNCAMSRLPCSVYTPGLVIDPQPLMLLASVICERFVGRLIPAQVRKLHPVLFVHVFP